MSTDKKESLGNGFIFSRGWTPLGLPRVACIYLMSFSGQQLAMEVGAGFLAAAGLFPFLT